MISINFINIENFFKFSFLRESRKSGGVDQIFYSVGFSRSIASNWQLLNKISYLENNLFNVGHEPYQLHLQTYILGAHYGFITDGIMSPESYLETLNLLLKRDEGKIHFQICALNVYRGCESEKIARKSMRDNYVDMLTGIDISLLQADLLKGLSFKNFEREMGVKIDTVVCEKKQKIGVILTKNDEQ